MGIVVVPLFPDVELQQWISWMENYFDREGLTDFEKLPMAHGFIVDEAERYIDSLKPMNSWKEMKETLLLKFGADDDLEKMRLKPLLNGDMWKRPDLQSHSHVVPVVESTLKVPYLNLEQNENDSQLGYQERNAEVDQHVELPIFVGVNPESWIV
ncbi:unnamed protein product [Eruca vesicaria subsp. sativa]|uniref:Uncharacterized protein n=1 Tax=Eruca vesicaria subsp. sativa TaxID=29727 RepID=A0ABC8KSF6_ERUVS|nr:unnamed protein product [Eruca vesicaria subsp. sativa]